MNSKESIKSEYNKYKRRSSLLSKVAKEHGVTKSYVCNVIAGRKKSDKILKSVKKLISK